MRPTLKETAAALVAPRLAPRHEVYGVGPEHEWPCKGKSCAACGAALADGSRVRLVMTRERGTAWRGKTSWLVCAAHFDRHRLKRFRLDGHLKVYECVCGEKVSDAHPDFARLKFRAHAPGFTQRRRWEGAL